MDYEYYPMSLYIIILTFNFFIEYFEGQLKQRKFLFQDHPLSNVLILICAQLYC